MKKILIIEDDKVLRGELKILLKDAQEVFPDTVLTRDRMSFDIPLKDNAEA